MEEEIDFQETITLIKRFLGLPNHWYGDLTLKFQAGDVVNVRANNSYDMDMLNNSKLKIKTGMIVKFGTKNLNPKDKDSSKIVSSITVEKDKDDKKIVKESKLTTENSK